MTIPGKLKLLRVLTLSAALWLLASPTGLPAQESRSYSSERNNKRVFDSSQTSDRANEPTDLSKQRTRITSQSAESDKTSKKSDKRGRPITSLWKTLGALSVVIILILILSRVWRKHGPASAQSLPPEAFEVLGRKQLDQRQVLHLVRLGSRILVLGSAAGDIRTLSEITDPVEVDYLAGLCHSTSTEGNWSQTFRAYFNRDASTAPDNRSELLSEQLDDHEQSPALHDTQQHVGMQHHGDSSLEEIHA